MADPKGFLKHGREVASRRDVAERVHDWNEVYPDGIGRALLPIISTQAGRCMDCGIPFCHQGCPLGNIIPEWNDLVWRDDWDGAMDRLHATNNFPEFTGRLCPAPCETACVLGINQDPVTIKNVEVSIIDRAWGSGYVRPQPPEWLSGKTVAVIGSGPAGLAAAQQLTRAGHTVAVYERADKIGGLLRYGIPEFKMEKKHLDRRLDQMRREGTVFRAGVDVGGDLTGPQLLARYDAVVLAMGATDARDLPVTGRELGGIHQAMEFLPQSNRASLGEAPTADGSDQIVATGKDVVIIGGGDTGADCLGTSIRQGARSITQLEIMPQPGEDRPAGQPWPTYPMTFRVSSAHEEGGDRVYAVSTQEFVGDADGNVAALRLVEVDAKFQPVEGTEREIPAQLVLLAMGFVGPRAEAGPHRAARASTSTSAATSSATSRTPPRCRASSSPATSAAASRSSCGRSPRVAARPPRSTPTSPARRRFPRRSSRTSARWSSERAAVRPGYCLYLPPCPGVQHRPASGFTEQLLGTIQLPLGSRHVRRAKIVCTLGPAVNTPEGIRALVEAGMDVARLNMSHGAYADHEAVYRLVRQASDDTGHAIGVFADLQGPKIRLETFGDGPVQAQEGRHLHHHDPRRRRRRRPVRHDLQGPAGRREAGRPAAHRRRQGAPQGDVGRRHRRGDRGRRARQGLQQQGHQPPRRRGLRAGAVGEGHRGPALGAAARRRLHRAELRAQRRATPPTCARS